MSIDELEGIQGTSIVTFMYRIVPRDNATFHANLAALLKSGTAISRGIYPEDYYLIDLDFYSEDSGDRPASVVSLTSVCTIIRGLQSLAIYHDQRNASRLVFVAPSESSTPHVVIEPKISEALLVKVVTPLDLRIIEDLSSESGESDPHRSAKCGVFGVTITEFLKSLSPTESFDHLIANWTGFLDTYQKNLGTYLSGFAFHKAKREVAKAEFDFADQYGKLIGEIATKLFSIPLSFAAIATLPKSTSLAESIVVILGLIVVGIIVSGTVDNQEQQLIRVSHAKDLVLGALEGRKQSYPDDLKNAIDSMEMQLTQNEASIKKKFRLFKLIGWLPLVVGLLVFGWPDAERQVYVREAFQKVLVLAKDSGASIKQGISEVLIRYQAPSSPQSDSGPP